MEDFGESSNEIDCATSETCRKETLNQILDTRYAAVESVRRWAATAKIHLLSGSLWRSEVRMNSINIILAVYVLSTVHSYTLAFASIFFVICFAITNEGNTCEDEEENDVRFTFTTNYGIDPRSHRLALQWLERELERADATIVTQIEKKIKPIERGMSLVLSKQFSVGNDVEGTGKVRNSRILASSNFITRNAVHQSFSNRNRMP